LAIAKPAARIGETNAGLAAVMDGRKYRRDRERACSDKDLRGQDTPVLSGVHGWYQADRSAVFAGLAPFLGFSVA
jgi:hypothetical protein